MGIKSKRGSPKGQLPDVEVISTKTTKKGKLKDKRKDKVMKLKEEIESTKDNTKTVKIAKMGCPSDYNYDAMLLMYSKYIQECEDSWEKLHKTKTRGTAFNSDAYDYKLKVKLPSIEGFAQYTGFFASTLYVWGTKYADFNEILMDLRERQAEKLLNGGLSGRYNPVISKLLLSKHGYIEQSEETVKQTTTISFARPASPFNKQVDAEKQDEQ